MSRQLLINELDHICLMFGRNFESQIFFCHPINKNFLNNMGWDYSGTYIGYINNIHKFEIEFRLHPSMSKYQILVHTSQGAMRSLRAFMESNKINPELINLKEVA